MKINQIVLDFGSFQLDADLKACAIAERFAENLPCTIALQQWGDELYGPMGVDLGEEDPVPIIPPGGIAYSSSGHYLCIFFGQTPAWPVEYIGQIPGDTWKELARNPSQKSVTVSVKR